MGTYEAFRENGGPTLYDSNKTSVTVDVLEIGLIFATVILFVSFVLALPGFSGRSIITTSVKVVLGVFITSAIMLCNFGQEWEVAEIHTRTQYRAGISDEIDADVGVKIGLRSVNITLKTSPENVDLADGRVTEKINYNERFGWDNLGWVQGRAGFGPFAGMINQEFREAQQKGLPYPILWIAEYFILDGEGVRWGRHYRQAGYYTHIMVWLAFPVWLIAMILMHVVIRYGGYMSILTSICLFTSNIIYACVRNPLELKVPFEDAVLEFHWGWCFWLNIFNGFLTLFIGFAIILADILFYEKIIGFFGVEILSDYDEIYADASEVAPMVKPHTRSMKKQQTLRRMRRQESGEPSISSRDVAPANTSGENGAPPPIPQKRQFRKRGGLTVRRTKLESKALNYRQDDIYELDDRANGNNSRLVREASGEFDNNV